MRFFQTLTLLLLLLAVGAVAAMIGSDALHGFRPLPAHARAGALPLILIGLACLCLQPTVWRRRSRSETVKGILLGLAFVLWGSEQLLPPTRITTLMDEAVIGIFVVDLGLVIWELLRPKAPDLP